MSTFPANIAELRQPDLDRIAELEAAYPNDTALQSQLEQLKAKFESLSLNGSYETQAAAFDQLCADEGQLNRIEIQGDGGQTPPIISIDPNLTGNLV